MDFKVKSSGKNKTLSVAVWYPTKATPKPYCYGGPTNGNIALDAKPLANSDKYPLLVFSHGYGGCGMASVFFTESLAAKGWIVVAPDHNDRHSAVRSKTGPQKFSRRDFLRYVKQISSSKPEDRGDYLYRLDEMQCALNGIIKSRKFGKLINQKKIAVGGHSFGGFTALGLCGTIPSRTDRRIKAVLLFSTGAGGYLYKGNELAAVKIPSMLYLGEREKKQKRGDKNMAKLTKKIFNNLAAPKYLLEIKGASHFSFNNCFSDTLAAQLLSGTNKQFDVIRRYAIAFLEKHVNGKTNTNSVLEKQDTMLSDYKRKKVSP
ncbi:MAG: hypothetical protein K8S55_15985 [Phycisphaerae bacterium]|nr:hypothetical protein [Phycisphaerae bacterium]